MRHHQENQASIKRIQSGKDLASLCGEFPDRSHTSKEHRCINKGIVRWLPLELPVSDHSGTKRHTNKRNSDQEVAEHPQEECTSGQWWVTTMFIHRR
jgi:hypothetical protein